MPASLRCCVVGAGTRVITNNFMYDKIISRLSALALIVLVVFLIYGAVAPSKNNGLLQGRSSGRINRIVNTPTSFATTTGTGPESILLIATSTAFEYALVINDSDTIVYMDFKSDPQLNEGIRLNANGGSYEIKAENLFQSLLRATSSASGKNILVIFN